MAAAGRRSNPHEAFLGLLLRLGVPGRGPHGEPLPEPTYGGQLQPFAIDDVPVEGTPRLEVEEVAGTFADGEPYTLLAPTYGIDEPGYGELDPELVVSPRVAPAMIGLGLLEAIPVERLDALEDPDDADEDGISGRLNRVWDMALGREEPGRFGWKAEQPSVRQQAAGAFLGDLGLTTPLFVEQDCTAAERECAARVTGGDPEVGPDILDRVEIYARLLAVPARQDAAQAPVRRGQALFSSAGCDRCHVPRHETGNVEDLPELSHQVIFPYTDLLLHDLGEGLSDGRPSFGAGGSEWRTPPLWGVGRVPAVNGHDRLLHDGRARGVAEAVLWHDGEGASSREAFRSMTLEERSALVVFVESL